MNSDELDRLLELADCFDTGSLIARLAAALRSLRPDAERWRRVGDEGIRLEPTPGGTWIADHAADIECQGEDGPTPSAALDALPRRKT